MKALKNDNSFIGISKNFQEEVKVLNGQKIYNWRQLKSLKEETLLELSRESLATSRNLFRLHGIASLICDLNLPFDDAALLIHSGVGSVKALAELNPQELHKKAGRLQRSLNITNKNRLDLAKANSLILTAKRRQLEN